jgi:hypothetical protein
MKEFAPIWPAVLSLLLMLCAIGAYAALRDRSGDLKPWVAGLLIAAVLALTLEIGVSDPMTDGVVKWLDTNLPLYRGMRDAGKWAAVLALVYSQLAAIGAVATLNQLRKVGSGRAGTGWLVSLATALLLAAPLYYGNGLLYGAHGEVKPSAYPASWYEADRLLLSDPNPRRTLVLPWHEYLPMSFVRNQNSVIAFPAPTFFSVSILVSTDPEVPGIMPPSDTDQVAMGLLVKAGGSAPWAQVLAEHGVKYVLLVRESDWRVYSFLDNQLGLLKVADYGSIVLYRNTLLT